MMRLPAVCLALLMYAACGGGDSVPGPVLGTDVPPPPCCKALLGPDEMGHFALLSGSTAIADSRHLLIRDMATWQAFWSEYNSGASPVPPLPPIDFGRSMLAG